MTRRATIVLLLAACAAASKRCFGGGDPSRRRRRRNRSPRLEKARLVPGPQIRPDDALGPLQPMGSRRILVHLLRGRALVPPEHPGLRRVQAPVRGPAEDLQPDQIRPGRMGAGRQAGRHAVRRVHNQASRRIRHVRHRANRVPDHGARRAFRLRSPGECRQGDFRGLSRGGARDGRLLQQARLALARLLGAGMGDPRPERQLRPGPVPGAMDPVQGVHLQANRGAHERLRPRGYPLARRRMGPALSGHPARAPGPAEAALQPGHRPAAPRGHGPDAPARPDHRRSGRLRPLRKLPHPRTGDPGKAPPLPFGKPVSRWAIPGPTFRTTSTNPRAG